MKKYILALDQGTGSSRAIIFDDQRNVCAVAQQETQSVFPNAGWVEQDPIAIYDTQLAVAHEALAMSGIRAQELTAIGISNQRETTIIWERSSGQPVYPAIVWQDKRTSGRCEGLRETAVAGNIRAKTGLLPDPYFSASKAEWILQHVPGAGAKAAQGELLFGTVDSWLVWKLSAGALHITDASNASRTMLFNIRENKWDEELLELFGIPACMMPAVVDSSAMYGLTSPECFEGVQVPLAGIAGDQQAALFGQTCWQEGLAKNTYGTGCFLLMNTGNHCIESKAGLLSTVAWRLNNKITYALEGSIFNTGSAVKWLRDHLQIIGSAAETEAMCRSLSGNEGVYMVPAFSGLGAPYWDMSARGLFCGLTLASRREHMVRAVIESIAYQVGDVLKAMESDSGLRLKALKVDGGAARNNFLLQFQADVLNVPVLRPAMIEATALGAALLAGRAAGLWSPETGVEMDAGIESFVPAMPVTERNRCLSGWQEAVQRCRSSMPVLPKSQ